jgi:hypothetical protein
LRPRRLLFLLGSVTVAVLATASAATAQEQPFDLLSQQNPPAVPGVTVGYRLRDAAVVAVVPDAGLVDRVTDAVWLTEPVRFRFLEVRTADQVLARKSYTELRRTYGKRPAGLEKTSLQSLADSFGRVGEVGLSTPLKWLAAIVVAVFAVVVAVMLVVVSFVLVSAQSRRTRARKATEPTA